MSRRGKGRQQQSKTRRDAPPAVAFSVEPGLRVVVPAFVERLTPAQARVMALLQAAAKVARLDQGRLRAQVLAGRDAGLSWGAIGWSVGTSAQAARQRWLSVELERTRKARSDENPLRSATSQAPNR